MVKVQINNELEIYLDGYVKSVLDTSKEVIKKDWDMVFVVDGGEGTGKSTLAAQSAIYCDPSLTLDRITFTATEFRNAILSAEKYQAVVYDEAYTGLSSRATMSKINKALVQMLAEIRQKNLFVFVVMPTFFDLDKYVALWRSRGLFHVYTADNFKRGRVAFYNIDKKKELYVNGKKFYSYYRPKPNFVASFTGQFPLDHEVYKKKKRDALVKDEEKANIDEVSRLVKKKLLHNIAKYKIQGGTKISNEELVKITDYVSKSLEREKKQIEKDEIKLMDRGLPLI